MTGELKVTHCSAEKRREEKRRGEERRGDRGDQADPLHYSAEKRREAEKKLRDCELGFSRRGRWKI
jgi:hypothetical protein